MADPTPKCAKCGARMKEGFVVEVMSGKAYPNTWIEGVPESHYLHGLKMKHKITVPISTFRCVSCGYLESYARQSAGAEPIDASDVRGRWAAR